MDLVNFEGTRPVAVVNMRRTEPAFCGNLNGTSYISFKNLKASFKLQNFDEVSKEFKNISLIEPFEGNWNFE